MKKIGRYNYTTLRGRIIILAIFLALTIMLILINDSKILGRADTYFRNAEIARFMDASSIFVFISGMLATLLGALGLYDAFKFITSNHSYSHAIFSVLMVILGILMGFLGIMTNFKLFQLNNIVVSRTASELNGLYIFREMLISIGVGAIMNIIRTLSDRSIKKRYDKSIENDEDKRKRKKELFNALNFKDIDE